MALVRREVETQTSFMDKIIIQLKEIEPFLDRYVRTKLNQDSGSKVAKTVFGNSNEQPRLQKINVKTIRELTSFQKLLDEMSKRPEFTEGEKDIVEDLARNVVDPLQAKPNYHWTLLEFDQARKMLASLGELVGSRKEATCGSMVVDLCGGNGGSRHQNQRATNNIPLRNRHFVGRTGELDVIQKWIKDGNRLLTISGLGGVGKTSLAIEAAHEFMDQFAGGTYWINANGGRGESSIRSSMVKILSSKLSQQQMKAFENVELANLLTEHFCRYRCLAIIDNLDVEELSGLAKELVQGSWLQHSESSVIITSRLKRETLEEILMIQPVHITLECFSTEEGTKFLKKRIGRYKEKDDECKELVEELDGLPLALDHAGAHIKARRFKLTTFLKKFKTEKLKFLTKGKATKMTMASSDTHNTVVSTTWDMNLEYLITECKYAWEVAAVFSFVYPKHIPTILINEGFPRLENEEMAKFFSDEIKLKEIIFSLTKLSLFSEVHEDCLQVHRLVQELIREKVRIANSKMVVYDRAVRMLSCALEKIDSPKLQEEEQPSDMKVWSRVMDNVAYFLEHLKDQKMIFDKRLPLEAMCKLMDHTSLHYDILKQGPRAQEYRAMLQQNLREAKPDYRAKYASCLTAMERHAIQQLINPSSKVDMNDFYMRIPLATGPHGRIWTVTCPKLGKGNYALKTQRRRKFSKDTTLQEVDNLLQFGGHENLAKIYWAFVTEEDGFKEVHMVTEIGETSVKAMIEMKQNIELNLFKSQMSAALLYLHQCNITHGNVKPSNILKITANDASNPLFKLTDFCSYKHRIFTMEDGTRRMLSEHYETSTLKYLAPELRSAFIVGKDMSHFCDKVDSWSIGVVILECILQRLIDDISKELAKLHAPDCQTLERETLMALLTSDPEHRGYLFEDRNPGS